MAFAASKRKKIGSHLEQPKQLKLTSMIDLFTILIVFLLKSYSAVQLNVASTPNLTLPYSIATKAPTDTLNLVVAKNVIVVEGKAVAELTPTGEVVGVSNEDMLINPLLSELQYHAKRMQDRSQSLGVEFSGEITLQGDKEIPFKLLRRVMVTAGKAEFGEFKFAAYKQE